MSFRIVLAAGVAISLATFLPACKKSSKKANNQVSQSPSGAQGENSGAAGPSMVLPALEQAKLDQLSSEEFRNVFYQLGGNRYTTDNLHQLVFLPSPDLLKSKPEGSSPVLALQNLSKQFEAFKPSDLFEYGKTVAVKPTSTDTPSDPVTIVVVPGIFSEFVDTFAFHEVVTREQSSFAQAFKKALANSSNNAAKTDKSFQFETQSEVEAPITDFVKMGSIDDKAGKPRVQIMTLTSPMFSGESLGKLEINAEVYNRRLDKIFDLIGQQKKVVIVGYSRGAAVALEMLSAAEKQKPEWFSSIKGMVSVGGVIYGAAIADAAFDPKDHLNALLTSLQGLSDELELVPEDAGTTTTLAAATRNTGRWLSASASIGKVALSMPFAEGLGIEGILPNTPQMDSNLAFMKRIAFEKFDFKDPSMTNYFLNVKKFKWIMEKIVQGISTLTTEARVKWWQTHTIPAHIKYYSIAGTMGNVSTKEKGAWAQTGNSTAFASRAVDYLALRTSYYDLYRVSKIEVTDSQVSLDRARFLPEFSKEMNSSQAPFSAEYLGVLGADHWGMIFPYAVQTSGNVYSPFPRDIFAEALGIYLGQRLK